MGVQCWTGFIAILLAVGAVAPTNARPAGLWMKAHAPDSGFSLSYTGANQERTGFSPEPWHYRFGGTGARARHEAALGGPR